MRANLFDAVDRLESAMTFHRDRPAVLAGNLANLETPGYRPRDLERIPGEGPEGPPLAVTDARHLQASGTTGTTIAYTDAKAPAGGDGNAVSMERELAKIDANRIRYGGTAELASRRLALLRYAAADGGGG